MTLEGARIFVSRGEVVPRARESNRAIERAKRVPSERHQGDVDRLCLLQSAALRHHSKLYLIEPRLARWAGVETCEQFEKRLKSHVKHRSSL